MAYEESENSISINCVLMSNSTVNQSNAIPKLISALIEQGRTSADVQIKELLTDVQYPENLYALKYILEHEGNSVSLEMLAMAMAGLCPQTNDMAFSEEEAPIKLEWQLRTVAAILEQLSERKPTLTRQFLDNLKKTASMYKRANEKISQHERNFWKPNCSDVNKADESTKGFECNYDNKYLFKLIKNTLNSICGDGNHQQTSVDRDIAALKALLVSSPASVKMGLRMTTGVEVSLGDFELERAWMYLTEVFQVEPSGKPWYTTWRKLIKLQKTLDEWSREKEYGIPITFTERLFLEFLWFQMSLCYSDGATAENQEVNDILWFGVLDLVQQLIQNTFSVISQAICYYLALDSLNNAISEFIQFKSIEVLLSLEVKNKELFVTTPDDIVSCDEEHTPKLEMYHYLKEKLEVESKMHLKYLLLPDDREIGQDKESKAKGKCNKSPIDYVAEELKCPITGENVDGLFQLDCQHLLSLKVLSSLEKQECPYCRTELKKNSIYYLPQQMIYNNIQFYITKDDYDSTVENSTAVVLFDQQDNLKKKRRFNTVSTLNTIWKTITAPYVNNLLQKVSDPTDIDNNLP